ncbi:hypothetical protein AB0M20_08600 [Actinoplanes sp. NPDC051633]|uniref:YqeB family protein n=1 Tax=Actinoplanes sp. NPDC051633 TaxID=3155670 RepID=UPI00342DCAA5
MIVRTPVWVRVAVWVLLPAAGAGLLLGLDRIADFVLRLPWAPLRGVFRLIQGLPEPWVTIGALALGGIAGLVLAGLVDAESLTVRITTTEVLLSRPGVHRTVPKGEVAVVFRDRDKLVLLGRTGQELAREPCHLSPKRIEPALRATGIPWADKDPYADAYRRWVPDTPDVTPSANAVFAERQRALDRGDERDAGELREELARLGFVVRVERKRQHWRRTA